MRPNKDAYVACHECGYPAISAKRGTHHCPECKSVVIVGPSANVLSKASEITYLPYVIEPLKPEQPTGKLVKVVKPASYDLQDGKHRCAGCGSEVRPGLCYTGKVLAGFSYMTREKQITTSLGETTIETYRVPLAHYDRGYICDTCASDYRYAEHILKDGSVQSVPVVLTDRLPCLTPKDETEGTRSYKGFNTRTVRVK